jgi:hypothetical protein
VATFEQAQAIAGHLAQRGVQRLEIISPAGDTVITLHTRTCDLVAHLLNLGQGLTVRAVSSSAPAQASGDGRDLV